MPETPEIDTMADQHENAEDDAFSDEYETEDSENSQESASSEDMEMEIEDVALPMRKPVNSFSKAIIQSMKNDPKKRRASIAVWADSKLSELASQNASKSFKVSETPTTAPSRFQVIATTSISKDFSSEELLTNGPEDCLMNPRILERIFSYLSFKTLWIIRRVNTVWHRTIQSSADLIRFVDLSEEHGKTVDDKVLGNIALFLGSNVEVLILKNCWKLTSAGLRELAAYNPNIQVLDLSGCWDITDAGLNSLSLGCRRIKCLDLSNCRKVTDSGLYNLLATSQNLLDIHLSYCKALSDTSLASISTMCTNIRRLNLQRCLGITDVGYATFGTMLHNKLHELQISDCSFLTDSAMKHISESCPNLKVLNISFCCALSEVSIQYLTHGCPKMKAFDASFCGNAISDETISIIATNWKDLEKLSVRGCVRIGNAAVQYLVDNCRTLKTLNISSCKNVSDNILEQIPKEWTLLSAQTPLIESSGIGNGDVTGSSHIRRFTAP
jgi:F-box/leucine-rich repeat protein 7